MSFFTVKVSFPPLYVDYIRSKWSDDKEGPIFAKDLNGHIGAVVKLQLRKQPSIYIKKDLSPDEYIEFQLPYYKDLNVEYNNYISEHGEKTIRAWVKKQFYADLFNHIREMYLIGFTEIKWSINHFCDMHNIDPINYNYDSLKRAYLRFRNREKMKKALKKSSTFAALLSFACPLILIYL